VRQNPSKLPRIAPTRAETRRTQKSQKSITNRTKTDDSSGHKKSAGQGGAVVLDRGPDLVIFGIAGGFLRHSGTLVAP
jgi:hypothetical protein